MKIFEQPDKLKSLLDFVFEILKTLTDSKMIYETSVKPNQITIKLSNEVAEPVPTDKGIEMDIFQETIQFSFIRTVILKETRKEPEKQLKVIPDIKRDIKPEFSR